MQIQGLHKNIYRLYAYSRTQECLDVYRKQYEEGVAKWQKLKLEKVRDKICQNITGLSRATYCRHKTIVMGERVQIDHMTSTKNSVCIKHFQAWDRRSKFMKAKIYSHAKSSSAKKFLLDLVKNAPFKILSLQVDVGSKFMAGFEKPALNFKYPLSSCLQEGQLTMEVLKGETRIFREEFYAQPDLLADCVGAMNAELNKALNKYNTYKPHSNLNGLTPMQYIHNILLKGAV